MKISIEEWVTAPEDYQPEIIDPAIELAEFIVPDSEAA